MIGFISILLHFVSVCLLSIHGASFNKVRLHFVINRLRITSEILLTRMLYVYNIELRAFVNWFLVILIYSVLHNRITSKGESFHSLIRTTFTIKSPLKLRKKIRSTHSWKIY